MKRLYAILTAVALCAFLALPSFSRPIVVSSPLPSQPTPVTPTTPIVVTFDGSGRATVTLQFFAQTSGTPRLPFVMWNRGVGVRPVPWFVRTPERWGPVRTATVSQILLGTPYSTETFYIQVTDAELPFDAILAIQRL